MRRGSVPASVALHVIVAVVVLVMARRVPLFAAAGKRAMIEIVPVAVPVLVAVPVAVPVAVAVAVAVAVPVAVAAPVAVAMPVAVAVAVPVPVPVPRTVAVAEPHIVAVRAAGPGSLLPTFTTDDDGPIGPTLIVGAPSPRIMNANPVREPIVVGNEGRDGKRRTSHTGFDATVDRDGTVHFKDTPTGDLTDWALRLHGTDPYAYQKLEFAEGSEDVRWAMAEGARRERLRVTVAELPQQLARLWHDARLPAGERRRQLFMLWDECAEVGAEDLVEAATHARAAIVAFVRRELPADSADAFTDDELAHLNARRTSHAAFAPY